MEKNENCAPKHGKLNPIVRLFIVIYDDENGLQCPMAFDEDCDGALCAWSFPETIAAFENRKEARNAITISTKFAQLRKSQGRPENTDFTEFKKNLRVVEMDLPN